MEFLISFLKNLSIVAGICAAVSALGVLILWNPIIGVVACVVGVVAFITAMEMSH